MDLVDLGSTKSAEEGEMSNIAVGFAAQMSKRATSAQREANLEFEVLSEKCRKQFGSGREVQESRVVVTLDSLERASEAIPALEGATQEAYREASKVLEDGVPAKGPPTLIGTSPEKARLPNRMVLGSYVPLQECGRPLLDMVAPSPEVVREIIDR